MLEAAFSERSSLVRNRKIVFYRCKWPVAISLFWALQKNRLLGLNVFLLGLNFFFLRLNVFLQESFFFFL
jgi:hypothetical protein